MAIDVEPLIGDIADRIKAEEFSSMKQLNEKVEAAETAKQEAAAKCQQLETKVQALEAELTRIFQVHSTIFPGRSFGIF